MKYLAILLCALMMSCGDIGFEKTAVTELDADGDDLIDKSYMEPEVMLTDDTSEIAGLTEQETTPTDGWFLFESESGAKLKIDTVNMPGGSGADPSGSDPLIEWNDTDADGADAADEEAAQINANMTDTTEDAEVSDLWFTYMSGGSRTIALLLDGSSDQWEFKIGSYFEENITLIDGKELGIGNDSDIKMTWDGSDFLITDSADNTLESLDPSTGLREMGVKSSLCTYCRIETPTIDSGDTKGTVLRIDTDGHLETWTTGNTPAYIALGNGYATPIGNAPIVDGFTSLTPNTAVYPDTGGALAYSDNGEDPIGLVRSATEILFFNSGAITGPGGSGSYEEYVASSADDAEQNTGSGAVFLTSTELDTESFLEIGMRFTNVDIPAGATIVSAYITVQAESTQASASEVTIYADDAANDAQFTSATSDITDRVDTTASVTWTFASWTADQSYTTPDISSIIQEEVDNGSWSSGNAIAILLTYSSGAVRSFYSWDGTGTAPQLYVSYTY